MMPQAVLPKENRSFERLAARFPVRLKYDRNNFGSSIFLRDASAQGLRLMSRKRVFLNDSVSLEVALPDGKDPLTLNGRVVWIKTKGQDLWDFGLEFYKIDFMNLHRVFRLLLPEE